jgi:hypothetical protein
MRNAITRRVCASQQRTQAKFSINEERLRCRIGLSYIAYIFFNLVNQERTARGGLDSASIVLQNVCMACSVAQVSYMRTLVIDRKGFDLAALPAHILTRDYRVNGTDGTGDREEHHLGIEDRKTCTHDGVISEIKCRRMTIRSLDTQAVCGAAFPRITRREKHSMQASRGASFEYIGLDTESEIRHEE